MYEDRPEKDTPQFIQDELREYGGLSPDGQPIWRLVLAQNCRIHCFGRMNDVPVGLRKLADGDDAHAKAAIVPNRTEEGEFWIPRYRIKGWILQRWFPPLVWGTRERWESEKAPDGRMRLLAAYPQSGDYLMMPCGPWKTIMEAGDLKGAIRCYNLQQRNNPVNFDNYIQSMLAFEETTRQVEADNYADELAAQHRLGLGSILRSASKSAQSFRNVVSKHAAGGVHLGSSEKWG